MGSIPVSGQLPTYPSPNPTLTLTCYQLTVVGLGERTRWAVAQILILIQKVNAHKVSMGKRKCFWKFPKELTKIWFFNSFNLNLYFLFLMHLLLVSHFEYFFKKGKRYLYVHFVNEIFWWAECMQFLSSCVSFINILLYKRSSILCTAAFPYKKLLEKLTPLDFCFSLQCIKALT